MVKKDANNDTTRYMDLTGMRFRDIEVIEFVERTPKGHAIYLCKSKARGVFKEAAITLMRTGGRRG